MILASDVRSREFNSYNTPFVLYICLIVFWFVIFLLYVLFSFILDKCQKLLFSLSTMFSDKLRNLENIIFQLLTHAINNVKNNYTLK